MRILFCGDIVGRSGRDSVIDRIPKLRQDLDLDFVIVNGENAASGFGVTLKIAHSLFEAGVDVITSGNHIWDQRSLIGEIDAEPRLLRPANFPHGTPGRGHGLFSRQDGRSLLVLNLMGRLFMDPLDDPFAVADSILKLYPMAGMSTKANAILVDIHAEATSEKMALAHYLDGRVSLVVGTHTHAPTADHQILPGGTAYQSDAGMCGDYNSVIGYRKDISIARLTRKLPGERLVPADGPASLCAIFVETDDVTGQAQRIEPLRLGGCLASTLPTVSMIC